MVTWSEYSHVDIMLDDGLLIGAIAGEGVVIQPLWHRLDIASKAVVMDLPVASMGDAIRFAKSQVGKPYDWLGVFGIGLHRDWQEVDKWSCAELVAMVASVAGQKPFDSKFHNRITPQNLLMLNFEKTRVK
jgi:uncharacterized protein YycO